jgi:fructose-bisphosphate aldolase, class II
MKETYGVPVEEIQEAIKHGVRNINIDTDMRLAMTGAKPRRPGQAPPRCRTWPAPTAAAKLAQTVI